MDFSHRHEHDSILKQVYEENDYPLDRLTKNDRAVRGFTRELTARGIEEPAAEEVLNRLEYIRKTKRQTGGLPRLGRGWSGPKFVDEN